MQAIIALITKANHFLFLSSQFTCLWMYHIYHMLCYTEYTVMQLS